MNTKLQFELPNHSVLGCRRAARPSQAAEFARRVTEVASSMASLSPNEDHSPKPDSQLEGTAGVLQDCRRQQLLQCKNEQLTRQVALLQTELAVRFVATR